MSEQVKYLLVGAGLAAHHAVRGIRERDKEGRIVMVGEEKALFPADTITIAQFELELVGSRNGTLDNMKTGIALLKAGKLRPIISDIYPLDQINTAFDTVRKGVPGRVVVRIGA